MKRKLSLTLAFAVSLLPMLLNQYGGRRGVQEITGFVNLLNPIGIPAVLLFLVGVWIPFKDQRIGKTLGALGTVGIVISEVYQFFTWHVMTVTGEVSLQHSVRFAFPEFYIGFAVSIAMVAAYFILDRKAKDTPGLMPEERQEVRE